MPENSACLIKHNLTFLEALPIGIAAVLTIFIIVEFRNDCFVVQHKVLKKATGFGHEKTLQLT